MNIDTDLIYNDEESEKRRLDRKKRREARRKKSSGRRKVLSFLWGAKELAPIVNSTTNSSGDIDYEEIAQKVKMQEELLDNVITQLGDISNYDENFQLRAGIASSHLVANHGGITQKSLSQCISILSQANDHKSDFIDQIDMGIFSSDVLVNIKLQILPSLYEFYSSLSTLSNDKHIVEEYTSWLSNTATDLAKDVAFNWDKKSSYRDRETLFVCMLPTCAQIGVSAFYEYLAKYNGATRIINGDSSFELRYPVLSQSISELDMGYMNHPEKNMAWLKEQLDTILSEILPSIVIPKNQEMYYNRIKGSIISDIDSIAAECWKKESAALIEKIQNEIEGLSDQEVESIMMEKYNDPMPLSGFSYSLLSHIERWPGVISPIDTNLSEVSTMAEQKMAALWGLTEAVCQIRSNKQ